MGQMVPPSVEYNKTCISTNLNLNAVIQIMPSSHYASILVEQRVASSVSLLSQNRSERQILNTRYWTELLERTRQKCVAIIRASEVL